jgi:sialic acid synthase SpsE
MMTDKIKINGIEISKDQNVFFVAETGAFFSKDLSVALDYLDMSIEAGVDAFKTEILHSPDVVYKSAKINVQYQTSNRIITEDYREFIKGKVLSLDEYSRIFEKGSSSHIPMIATVFDKIGVDFLIEHKAGAIKISNNNVHNKPLIQYATSSNLPLIIDLGNVPLWKAMRALNWVRDMKGEVMFNYHPGCNPAPANLHNLSIIRSLQSQLRTPIGLSCHYIGDEILYAAIGAGVSLIEKGVDMNPDRDEADLVSAAAFDDLSMIVKKCKNASMAMGKEVLPVDESRLDKVRTTLSASRFIKRGELINQNNVNYSWPPIGISPEYWDFIENSPASVDIQPGDPIKFSDVEFDV